jgi:APA family basic amino acid/polyamine antiporter
MSSSKPGLFAREATGLVREIGFSVGVIIILSHVVGLGWQKRAFQFSGPMPMPTDAMPLGLPAMFWAFLVVGLVVLVTGYAAGYVAAAMPRSGGGYVTVSRIIHPSVGYMAGWLMFLAEAFSYGLIGVAVFEGIGIFFNIALASPGTATPGWLTAMGDPATIFVGGLLLVWIFALVALLGTKMYGRLMQVLFYIPAAITVLFFAMWIAGVLNPQVVIDGFTKVTGASPDVYTSTSLATGMADNPAGFFDAFSFALGGAFWAYMGWYATTFLAGEVKEANKKLPRVLLVAGLVIIVIYLAASSLSAFSVMNVGVATDTVGGHTWSLFQSYGWLSYGPQAAKDAAAAAIPNFQTAWSTGIATIIAQGMGLGWLAVIIAIGAVFWVANDIPPFLLVASRTFFAMSFDRMMPEKFSYVSERWHAPVWSLIITAVFAIPACMAEANFPAGAATTLAFAGVVGTDIFDATFLLMFCVSCLLLPLERRDIYDRAAVKHSVGTVVILGLLATLGAGFCLYIFIQQSPWIWSLFTSSASYSDIASSVGFLACIAAGVLLYVYHMYKNSTRGVDMRTLYIAIPPE